MSEIYLVHHGITGQKWGVRRFQNADGSLTEAGRKRLEKKDRKWAERHEKSVYRKTFKKSKREIDRFVRKELKGQSSRNKDGTLNLRYANAYNQALAEIMNKKVKDIKAPSGRVIRFVAKRGSMGVYTALANPDYNMKNVKKGVYGNGRVAYKKREVGVMRSER